MSSRFQISPAESVKILVQTCLANNVTIPNQVANVLAQCEHETGGFVFSEEIDGRSQAIRLGYQGGPNFFGRGYIQITHKSNYEKFANLLGIDLVNNPTLATEAETAAKIAVIGMRDGKFTGVGLSRYITESSQDYVNARRIVNGTDRAQHIANLTEKWLKEVDSLIAGNEPNPSLFVNVGNGNSNPTNNSSTSSNNNGLLGGILGTVGCTEIFPIKFTIEEAITYLGCFKKLVTAPMGGNSLSYPAPGQKVNGATNFDISDFDPTVPICAGCLGYPFKTNIRITSPFCQRRTSKSGRVYFHSGTDYGGREGAEVVAVADGTVISPLIAGGGYEPGFVDIQHEKLGGLVSRSAHIIPSIYPGDKVKQGDIIGKVGPYPSGGPHLHLELRKDKGAGGSAFSIQECKTKFLDPALFCRKN